MTVLPGIYQIYRNIHAEQPPHQKQLLGRILITGNSVKVLEDHDGLLEEIFPSGPLAEAILFRLTSLAQSPYYDVVHQDEIDQGERDDHIPEVKLTPDQWPQE